jgi:hypothetical protein
VRGKALLPAAGSSRVSAELGHDRLKFLLRLVLAIIVLALVLGALVIGSGMFLRPSCTTGVVITEGPHGEKIECVCVGGVHAACFEPGP